jgi:site-specific recombinase XerD
VTATKKRTGRVAVRGGRHCIVEGRQAEPCDAFLHALHIRGLSPHTLRSYAYDLLLFTEWMTEAGLTIEQLCLSHLVDFIASERARGAQPRSINRRLSTARLFVRFVTGSELEGTRAVSLPGPHYKGAGRDHDLGLHQLKRRSRGRIRVKEPQKLVEPLAPPQVLAFVRSLHRYRDLAITYLMLLCGLRSGEVLAIEISDVNFADGRLRVRGKGSRERALPLPPLLLDMIGRYLRLERPRSAQCSRLFLVLQGPRRGEPMTPAGLRSLFRYRRRQTRLRNANAHRFRHTFAADMARSGVRLPVLQRLMGHADAKTTLQYIRLSMADVSAEYFRAIEKVEKRYGRR